MTEWPAPHTTRPVDATVRVPGSKSMTNRALVIAALGDDGCALRRPLRSRDTELMAGGLRALGVFVDDSDDDAWRVVGPRGPWALPPGAAVDVGNAGTVARFLPAVAALGAGPARFDGDPRVRERPMAPLVAALRTLGVDVDAAPGDALPLTVGGEGGIDGGDLELDARSSSQFVSALLLVAPQFRGGLRLHVRVVPPSAPHVEMTVGMMRAAGACVTASDNGWQVDATGRYDVSEIAVEPDVSTASYFFAAAALTAGRVRVADIPEDTAQPGALLLPLLERMGARVSRDGDALCVEGPAQLLGITADLRDCGELAPTVAVLAARASTPSVLSGIAHLRGHETDRLAALAGELGALGAAVTVTHDGLNIEPRELHGGVVSSHDDHRLAMAFAALGLVVPGVIIDDVATTAKTDPGFVARWTAMVETAR